MDQSGDSVQAIRTTLATSGRAVLFSGLTVAAAMASLLVFPQQFLYSMGAGGVMGALSAVAVALLVLPAVLLLLGPRIDALSPARLRHRPRPQDARLGFWYRLSRGVMHRPGRVALATGALLLLLGSPFLGIKFTSVDASVLPQSASARQVDDALHRDFTADTSVPITVVVEAPAAAGRDVAAFAQRLRDLPNVALVTPPQTVGSDTWMITTVSSASVLSDTSQTVVRDIRALPASYPVLVAGGTAQFMDLQSSLRSHLPLAISIVALVSIAVLFAMTGSLLLPIKAVLMNALSLSAAFGLLVLIFQDGRLTGLLGYTSQGALESTQPILLFAIAFGLSTDYGVFLLSRIKEGHDAGLSTTEAVAHGLERTGRIVTAAAILFTIAIGAFSTSSIVFIKELGVGTALAVIIDASIVRALLVPALMKLLGDWNWWAPRPLRALHRRLGLGRLEGTPVPA
jgi:RND superfamily putative drug exporter